MSKKVLILIMLMVVAALLFVACEKAAPQPQISQASPTAGSSSGVAAASPMPTGMSLVQVWGTATAQYIQTAVSLGLITAAPTSTTPQPSLTPTPLGTPGVPPTGAPTSTPVPGATSIATTPVVIVPTSTPGRPVTYTLHQGEFTYCIARRFNVNPSDLLGMNGLVDSQILQPGVVLNIPQTGSFPGARALHAHPASYTVAVNDNFYSIACYFGDVDPTQIAAANGLSLSSPLTVGKVLSIP